MDDPLQSILFKLFDYESAIWNILTSDGLVGQNGKANDPLSLDTWTARWEEAMKYTWGITDDSATDPNNFMPSYLDWQNGKVDKAGKTLNQRFPFKSSDTSDQEFYETNVALYWFGSYAIGIWYTIWFSYLLFGRQQKKCLDARETIGPEACTDYLGWLHRYN